MRHDPARAVEWRQDMRQVLGAFMTVRRADLNPDAMEQGPIGVAMEIEPGDYVVDGFASWLPPGTDERMSYYILRKGERP